jgi:hypothetical protein
VPLTPSLATSKSLFPIKPTGTGLELAPDEVVFISFVRTGAFVPLVYQSSLPVPPLALKYNSEPVEKNEAGEELVLAAVFMFANNELVAAVGALVVLIRQSSVPFTPSFAE